MNGKDEEKDCMKSSSETESESSSSESDEDDRVFVEKVGHYSPCRKCAQF